MSTGEDVQRMSSLRLIRGKMSGECLGEAKRVQEKYPFDIVAAVVHLSYIGTPKMLRMENRRKEKRQENARKKCQ